MRDIRKKEVPLGSYELIQRASLMEESVWKKDHARSDHAKNEWRCVPVFEKEVTLWSGYGAATLRVSEGDAYAILPGRPGARSGFRGSNTVRPVV